MKTPTKETKAHSKTPDKITGLSTREEAYAVARASGVKGVDAFLHAYTWNGTPQGAAHQASKVEGRQRVADRIKTLRDEYAKTVVAANRGVPSARPAPAYGIAEAMDELNEAAMVAKEVRNAGALAKVVEVKMKLYGLGIGDAKNPADKEALQPEELEAALAQLKAMRAERHVH